MGSNPIQAYVFSAFNFTTALVVYNCNDQPCLHSVYFVSRPKQGLEIEGAILHSVGFLEYCCPKQGQDFKPLAAS